MNSRRRLISLFLAGALGAGGVIGWFKYRRAFLAEEELGLVRRSQELARRISDLTSSQASFDAERKLPHPSGRRTGTVETSVSSTKSVAGFDAAADNRRLVLMRVTQELRYGPFLKKLNLSANQIRQFETSLARHQAVIQDLVGAANSKGIPLDDPALKPFLVQEDAQFKSEELPILGADGLMQFGIYEQTIGLRSIVTNFAGGATLEGMPLSTQQLDQLVSVVIQAGLESPKQNKPVADMDWVAVDAHAASILSPEQAAYFRAADVQGPIGLPSRYQALLASVINKAYSADRAAEAH